MFAYIVKRVLSGFVVIFLVSVAVFALFWYGPRNPAAPLCQQDLGPHCNSVALARYTQNLGYNDSAVSQYGLFVKGIFFGRKIDLGGQPQKCPAPCMGIDYQTRQTVTSEFFQKFPATFSLAVGGATIYFVVGVTIGVLAARRRGTLGDRALVTGTLVMSSVPYYLVCLLAYIYLTIQFNLFPGSGYHPITNNPVKWFTGLLLPWLVLGLYNSTAYTRFSRGAMVETLNEDYIRTAKAKGLPTRTVVFKHALRAAIVPVVTIFGLDFASLLAGTIFTEYIFQIDGIGNWGLYATFKRDFPVVLTTVLLGAFVVVMANLIVDIIYSVLDPRVRLV
ncbi:MAG: ABC transporter permease [Actinomycetota bacterium]|nr:ABC transporter permease [Actinomycetota bacterium]